MLTREFVKNGFDLPEAKGGAQWLDKDTLLLSTAYGEGMATQSGYSRTVRLWPRGTDVDRAPVLFETTPETMVAAAALDRTQPRETVWYYERPGFFDEVMWIGDRTG